MKILINRIVCKHCKDILESVWTHDFKQCSCGKVGIDGGLDYLKRMGNREDYIDVSVVEEEGDNNDS